MLTPAPTWEVTFAMGLLRHGKVPPPVSRSRQEGTVRQRPLR